MERLPKKRFTKKGLGLHVDLDSKEGYKTLKVLRNADLDVILLPVEGLSRPELEVDRLIYKGFREINDFLKKYNSLPKYKRIYSFS